MLRDRRTRKRRGDLLGFVLVASAAVAVAGLGWFASSRRSAAELDERLCAKSGPAAVRVIVVDHTDHLSDVQRAAVRRDLENLLLDLPVNELLELYSVQPGAGDPVRPAFVACTTTQPAQVNPLVGNRRLVEARWESRFHKPLATILDELLAPKQQDSSPILETIQFAAIDAFRGPDTRSVPKYLLIVSDMLQNTPGYSQYEGKPSFADYRSSPHYHKSRPRLDEVNVEIWYLRRDNAAEVQGRRHIEFWEEYFRDVGATLTRVVAVEG